MAQKVAMSLIAPANKNARGHKMFLKRKQKSTKWSTDFHDSKRSGLLINLFYFIEFLTIKDLLNLLVLPLVWYSLTYLQQRS